MLAQNFKTARALNISKNQLDALILTLVYLETGKLKWTPHTGEYSLKGGHFTGHFNMNSWFSKATECKTICCIGGTAELLGNVKFEAYQLDMNEELFFLFFAGGQYNLDKVTIEEAALGLRSYLTTGHANWDKILA